MIGAFPGGVGFDHRVEDGQEFAHAGDDLPFFTSPSPLAFCLAFLALDSGLSTLDFALG